MPKEETKQKKGVEMGSDERVCKMITAKMFLEKYISVLDGNTEKLRSVITRIITEPDAYKRLLLFQEIALKMGTTPRKLANKVKKWHSNGQLNKMLQQ